MRLSLATYLGAIVDYAGHYRHYFYEKGSVMFRLLRFLSGGLLKPPLPEAPLFIHVPRTAGTSIVVALKRHRDHHSARFYENLYGRSLNRVESFAVLRDPMDRCLSAYFFIRRGGTKDAKFSRYWEIRTHGWLSSFEEYVDWLWNNRSSIDHMDYIMRTQDFWIRGKRHIILPDKIFMLNRDNSSLEAYLIAHGAERFPRLNESGACSLQPSPETKRKVREIYQRDYRLIEELGLGDGFAS